MASTTFFAARDARTVTTPSSNGGGACSHLPVGTYLGYDYHSHIYFTPSWTGIPSAAAISSAKLRVRTSNYHVALSTSTIRVRGMTSFTEGTAGHPMTPTNGGGITGSSRGSYDGTYAATFSGGTSSGQWKEVDITNLVKNEYGNGNFAIVLTADSGVCEFSSRETAYDPQIIVTYNPNTLPSAPTLNSPTGGTRITDTTPDLVFTHSDPDGDPCSAYDLQVSTDNTFVSVTHWDISNQTTGISGDTITRAYAGTALSRGVTYYWRARTSDAVGMGTWSGAGSFVLNQLPVPTKTSPSGDGELAFVHNLQSSIAEWTAAGTDAKPRLSWSFADADGHAQTAYQVRIYDAASGGTMLYDSTKTTSILKFHDADYGIKNGDQASSTYWWTVEVWDSLDESSGESSRTSFKVLWGQAIYEDNPTGGAASGQWSLTSSSVGAEQKAFLFRNATGASGAGAGSWKETIGEVTPAAYLNVLVRLATTTTASNVLLPDMTFHYVASAVFPDKWTTQASNPGDWVLDEGVRRFGTRALVCAVSTASGDRYIYPETDITVQPATEYTFSAFVKTAAALASGAALRLRVYEAGSLTTVLADGGTGDSDSSTTDTSGSPEGWQRLLLKFTTGAGVTSVRPMIHYLHNGSTSGDVFWADAVMVEEGEIASPWRPGTIGAVTMDSGGIAIDAYKGAAFRLRGATGGSRDIVELGDNGLIFGGDVLIDSPSARKLVISAPPEANVVVEGILEVENQSSPITALRVKASADTEYRFRVDDNGAMDWGPGGVTVSDTTLYRAAAGILQTDDIFRAGALQLTEDETLTSTGTQNDWAVAAGSALVRWNGASACTATGIASGSDGRILVLANITTGDDALVLTDEGAGSTAANRIICPLGESFYIEPGEMATLIYDATSSRWRVMGKTTADRSCIAVRESNQTITSTATIQMNATDEYDPFGMHSIVTNNTRITVPWAGNWTVHAEVHVNATATYPTRWITRLYVNGSLYLIGAVSGSAERVMATGLTSVAQHWDWAWDAMLSANDYVEIELNHNSGTSQTLNAARVTARYKGRNA